MIRGVVNARCMTGAIYDRDQRPSPEEIPMREALVSFLHVAPSRVAEGSLL